MGPPAVTTLGMKAAEMKEIGSIVYDCLKEAKGALDEKTKQPSKAKATVPESVRLRAQQRVAEILKGFPLYPELVID